MSVCPGCGVARPDSGLAHDRKSHASKACWALFEQVLAAEYRSLALLGRAHRLPADAYAVRHPGAAGRADGHVHLVRAWASEVWRCRAPHHGAIRALARGS